MKTSSIYIANINWAVDQNKLAIFLESQSLGIRDVKLIVDHDTGQSRGFAFAKIDDPEVLPHVIQTLNGMNFEGRPLVVREALPKPDPREMRPAVALPRYGSEDDDYRPGRR